MPDGRYSLLPLRGDNRLDPLFLNKVLLNLRGEKIEKSPGRRLRFIMFEENNGLKSSKFLVDIMSGIEVEKDITSTANKIGEMLKKRTISPEVAISKYEQRRRLKTASVTIKLFTARYFTNTCIFPAGLFL